MNLPAFDSAASLILRGHEMEDAGDAAAALALYDEAAHRDPGSVSAQLNRGNALLLLNRHRDAIAAYRQAVTLGDSPGAWLNIGNLCLDINDLVTAKHAYLNALRLRQNWMDPRFGLLCVAKQSKDASLVEQLKEFLDSYPGHPDASLMLAEALVEEDPILATSMINALPQQDARSDNVLALAALAQFDSHRGLAYLERALAQAPGNAAHLTFLSFTRMIAPTATANEPVTVIRNHLPKFPDPPLRLRTQGPYRVGYISYDYRAHPAAHFLMPLLLGHRRDRFSVIAINNLPQPDILTPHLLAAADEVIDIALLNDEQACALLREAALDVVIDFSGWTIGNRLPLLARRIAPVQMTAIGVYMTTGVPAVDFRICDASSDPPGLTEAQNSEQLLRTEGPNCCYHELRPIPASSVQPARQNGYFTFGFFNNSVKITRTMIGQWVQILRHVPSARMKILGVRQASSKQWLREYLDDAGVGSRVEILSRVNVTEYCNTLTTVDLALDSHPYNGGTTTIECLLAGVPVLTHSGSWSFSRSARVFLDPVGLSDWSVNSADAFVNRAVQVAMSPLEPLEMLRAELPKRVRASALMDQVGYIARWEAVLHEAIEIRRAKLQVR